MGYKNVDRLDSRCELNDCIDTVNWAVDSWEKMVKPMDKHREACMKFSKLDKVDGAEAKHIILGMMVSACADKDTKFDDIKGEVEILDKKPWMKFGPNLQQWGGLTEHLP